VRKEPDQVNHTHFLSLTHTYECTSIGPLNRCSVMQYQSHICYISTHLLEIK